MIFQCVDGTPFQLDEADAHLLGDYRWYAMRQTRTRHCVYVMRAGSILLHRLVIGYDREKHKGLFVDHINGDTLDNRRANLRLVTHSQNMAHDHHRRKSSTGYRRVYPSGGGKFVVIMSDGASPPKARYYGTYDTAEEAAHASDEQAIRTYGKFARLNFPR